MKYFFLALLILAALNIADIAVTVTGLSRGAIELNPIYHMQGFKTAVLIKLSLPIIAMAIFTFAYRTIRARFPKYVKVLWLVVIFLIGFYTFVVVYNIFVLLHVFSIG